MMVTRMACYGAPGDFADDGFIDCTTDEECGPGLVCDPNGFCSSAEQCFNGFDDDAVAIGGIKGSKDQGIKEFQRERPGGTDRLASS